MQYKAGNSLEIKQVNKSRIFQLIYRRRKICKQEIASELQLSLPTVTQNIKELQNQGLVIKNGTFSSTGGRKARILTFAPEARFSLGIEITKDSVGIIAVNLAGQVTKSQRCAAPYRKAQSYYFLVSRLLGDFIQTHSIEQDKILGVGISVQGLLSPDGQTVAYGKILGSVGEKLDSYQEYIPYPCMFCHDADAAAFAEMWISDHIENAVYLNLGNNVGGSVFIANRPYSGRNARSGIVEHMTLVPDGVPCYCGQRGCMESYCAAHVLTEKAGESLDEFFKVLRSGEPKHQAVWEEYLYYLSIAVNNLHMIFDCDIILGGRIGACMEKDLNKLKQMAAERDSFGLGAEYIRLCRYTTEAVAAGAALQYIDAFIQSI